MRPLIIALALALAPLPARADVKVVLADGSSIVGRLLHYYDGLFTVGLPGGGKMRLPAGRVRRLVLDLPKPRAALSTPKKAFARLRRAALTGDLAAYIDAHSAFYALYLERQVAAVGPKAFVARLKDEWGNAQIQVLGVEVKGDTAVMRVRRKKGGAKQDGELRFVRENGEWKMILPL